MIRREPQRRSGCAVLLLALLITCLMLLVNRVLATSLYNALVPSRLEMPRLRTIVQFFVMVGLLLPEWWMIDYIMRFLWQLRHKAEQREPDE